LGGKTAIELCSMTLPMMRSPNFLTSFIEMGDFQTWIISREDLILSKLRWTNDSRSEMQLRDVRNLLASGYDEAYLRSHAQALGVAQLLEELLATE